MTAPARPGRPRDLSRPEVLDAVAPLLDLLGLEQADVMTLHVGHTTVSARLVSRGRRGHVIPGVVVRRSHRVLPEPVED